MHSAVEWLEEVEVDLDRDLLSEVCNIPGTNWTVELSGNTGYVTCGDFVQQIREQLDESN
jgi:hypothetical protein